MILDTIVASTRERVIREKKKVSLDELKSFLHHGKTDQCLHNRDAFAFEKALKKEQISMICEIKKASPSKGVIAEHFPYLDIAEDYEAAGADAISVLTEPEFFQGNKSYLSKISAQVNIPILQKDFIIDEYQIYEAKLIGADAILLIAAILDLKTMQNYLNICNELRLSALVETHSKEEIITAINAGARVIGVNNRNLQTFEVDIQNSLRLRSIVPENIVFVAESGIQTAQDVEKLQKAGVNAVLIGEVLMKSDNKRKVLQELKGNRG